MIKELPKTRLFIKTKKCDVFVALKEIIVRKLTQSKCVSKQTTTRVFYFLLPDVYTYNAASHSACTLPLTSINIANQLLWLI